MYFIGVNNMEISQGDIFRAGLNPVIGSEMGSVRPVLVITNNIANEHTPTVTITPLTTQINEEKLPTHVKINAESSGLDKDAIILVEQIRTIDKSRLREKVGEVNNVILSKVKRALQILVMSDYEFEYNVPTYQSFELNSIFHNEEKSDVEFKSITSDLDPVDEVKKDVYKLIGSFLNSEGGRIYYGISNMRKVNGVNLSYEQRDSIRQALGSMIGNFSPPPDPGLVKIVFHEIHDDNRRLVDGLFVIEIFIPKPAGFPKLYFDKNGKAYVRANSSSEPLTPQGIQEWTQQRIMDFLKVNVSK